jgi:hypothetical protein
MKSLLAGFGSLYGDGANREKPYNPHTVKQLDDFPRFPRQPPGSDAQRNDAMCRELDASQSCSSSRPNRAWLPR